MGTANDVVALSRIVTLEIGKAVASLLVLLVVAGVGASAFQNLPQFVGERIRPQASRISISKGWKRLFGVQGFVEFLKSLGKLGFAVLVLTFTLSDSLRQFLAGMLTQTTDFVLVIREHGDRHLVSIVFVMGLIAGVDLVWSRFHWRQDLRMTKQEVKDELKQSEGDPIVKIAAALAGARPRPPPHDDGGAARDAGDRQPDALFDRAEICPRGGSARRSCWPRARIWWR